MISISGRRWSLRGDGGSRLEENKWIHLGEKLPLAQNNHHGNNHLDYINLMRVNY